MLGRSQPAAFLAVLRCENLEAAAQLEARFEHVQVVVVVFDVEHFGHVADSVLLTAALISSSPFPMRRVSRTLSLARRDWLVLGATLNRSDSRRAVGTR